MLHSRKKDGVCVYFSLLCRGSLPNARFCFFSANSMVSRVVEGKTKGTANQLNRKTESEGKEISFRRTSTSSRNFHSFIVGTTLNAQIFIFPLA
jgi:hypothetical protein